MRVIENENFGMHNPRWKFTLGPDTYETRDTPKRVEVIKEALGADPTFRYEKARDFPERALSRLHPYHDYIKQVSESLDDPRVELYPDLFPGEGARLPKRIHPLWGGIWCTDAVTPLSMHTYAVARGSAQAALTGAALLAEEGEREVYALCRPSGHHAGPRVFGGYCYFNNAAAAADLLSRRGRVAIVDIDYHHGNGTQEFFEERKDVFTCSIHGDPEQEYPYFWGYAEELGVGQGAGSNLNLPMPLGSGTTAYLAAVDRAVDAMTRYAPDFLIVSAGFDTHADDPIGGLKLQTADYPQIGRRRLAQMGLPTLICQEGGYNTDVLGASVHGFLRGFVDARVDALKR